MPSWLSVGKEVGDAAGGVLGAVFDGVDKLITSDEEREKLANVRAELEQQPQLWQALQNRLEAQHRSVFVAGWRPAVGWVCAFALGYNFVAEPLLNWLLNCVALFADIPFRTAPHLDIGELISILLAMLGMAGYRTYEKKQGVAK